MKSKKREKNYATILEEKYWRILKNLEEGGGGGKEENANEKARQFFDGPLVQVDQTSPFVRLIVQYECS